MSSSSTWGNVETATRAIQATHSASTTTTTSTVFNADAQDLTGTNLNVCTGLLMFCNQTTSTGTVKVVLSADSGTTETRAVTVNATDLPTSPSWVFFEFGSTLTLDGGTDYAVGIQGSSAGNATFYRDGTTANWTHLLMLNGSGTPGAGDTLYVVGELTGAGTGNSFTVTMDSTASTDYGAIEMGKRGTLSFGTSASTNYVLRTSAVMEVWGDGTLSIGTTGTPIPRNSSAQLEFDCSSDGEFGLVVENGGTFNAQGLSRTAAKLIDRCLLNTDEAAAQTVLGVDTDTGWLNGDDVGIASTTRTYSQCETRTLSGDAGASSITVSSGLTNAHSGTSPTQAEVILLTRNVRVRSVSTTAMAYVNIKSTATVDCDWAEFRYLGENATGKRGVEIETTTGSTNLAFCSFRDFEDQGIYTTGSAWNNVTVTDCVLYNCAQSTAPVVQITTTTGTSWTFNRVITMLNVAAEAWRFNDYGGTFTDCKCIGSNGDGIVFNEDNATFGTCSGITSHSCGSSGIYWPGRTLNSSFSNFTVWRSGGTGIFFNGRHLNNTYDTFTLFGNTTWNIRAYAWHSCTWRNITSNGDTTFSTTVGIEWPVDTTSVFTDLVFENCDWSTVTGIKTAHSTDWELDTVLLQATCRNCKFGAATEFANQSSLYAPSFVRSQKHDQTAATHKTLYKYGTVSYDTGTVRSGSPAELLTPNNASNKLESGKKKVALVSGETATVTVYVNKSASYNGNQPRLIVKRNVAAGISSDTVLATASGGTGSWLQLTGTTAAVTDDALLDFVVDCDGTAGTCSADDWSVT